MRVIIYSFLFLAIYVLSSCSISETDSQIIVSELTVDHLKDPLSLDNPSPRFSWISNSVARGASQSAYRLLVASDPALLEKDKGDIWDTGRRNSDQSVFIDYHGIKLKSGQRYFWKVMIWDQNNNPSPYSTMAWFEMGKMNPDDWQARWISQVKDHEEVPELLPAPYFRKEFSVARPVASARLYLSGLGYYKAFINGNRTGDHEIDPAFTRYDRRVKYVKHDVTGQLREGRNCIGIVLGNGWYNQHTASAWDLDSAAWRDDPCLLAQLELVYADGGNEIITTDETWMTGNGPIVFDGIRNGEHYDARKEIPGWYRTGYDDSGWKNALVVKGPAGKLSAQVMPPMRIIREKKPIKITEPAEGTYVVHFAENITGRLRISLEGSPGQEIIIRYGERLKEDGTLDQKELARFIWTGETQTDRYICKGEGRETWESSFVYHGFEYAEITGLSGTPVTADLTGVVLHTDLQSAGEFSCSNTMFNALQQNILNSFLGNYHGYPTDCPHREKIGWSGDAQLVSATALYNFDMVPSYMKWIDDFADEQRDDGKVPAIIPTSGWGYTYGRGPGREHGYGPHWDGAYINIPWDMYRFTGDTFIIKKYYKGFKAYMTYLERSAEDYILNYGINDHKQLTTKTEGDYLSTVSFFDLANKMSSMAGILGFQEDEVYYKDLAGNIYKAFNRRFYNEETGLYGSGGQTALSGALFLGLVPEGELERVTENLVNEIEKKQYHIDAGVVGTLFMLKGTTELGLSREMYKVANQRDYPGWGNWIERGATTLWQTWDGTMSLNHIMFGSIGEWFYQVAGGIRVDPHRPGFKVFILKPELTDTLEWVKCKYGSVYGQILSEWKRESKSFHWKITVPFNTMAKVFLPVKYGDKITESDQQLNEIKSIRVLDKLDNHWILEVASGIYNFEIQ